MVTKTSQLQNDTGFASDWTELNNKPFHYDEIKIIRQQDIQPYEIIINYDDWNLVEIEDDEGSIIDSYCEVVVDCSTMGYYPGYFKEFRGWWDDGRPEGGASARGRVPMYLVFENYDTNRPNSLLGTNVYLTTDIDGNCQNWTYVQNVKPCGNMSYRFEAQNYIWDEETGEVLQEEKLRLHIKADESWSSTRPNKIIFSLGWINPQRNIPEDLLENSVSWDMLRNKPFCDDDITYTRKIGEYDLYFDEDYVEEDPDTGEIIDEWPAENPLPAEDEQYTFETIIENETLSDLYWDYYNFFIQKGWSFDSYNKDGYEVKEEVDERDNNIFTLYWSDDCPCIKTEFVGLGVDQFENGVSVIFTFRENIFETYTYYSFFLGDNYYKEVLTCLDEKYIPDTIVRKSDLTLNNVLSNESSYIENIIYDQVIEPKEQYNHTWIFQNEPNEMVSNDYLGVFEISVNKENVKCILRYNKNGFYESQILTPIHSDWSVKAGNMETMEGYRPYLQVQYKQDIDEHRIVIKKIKDNVNQLNDEYIPDTIARIGNLSAKEIACSGEIDGIAFTNLQQALDLLIAKLI